MKVFLLILVVATKARATADDSQHRPRTTRHSNTRGEGMGIMNVPKWIRPTSLSIGLLLITGCGAGDPIAAKCKSAASDPDNGRYVAAMGEQSFIQTCIRTERLAAGLPVENK
jgi:hypothetical protein